MNGVTNIHSDINRGDDLVGLCVIDDRFIAGGSSPSTVTLYDLKANEIVASVNITMDIRNAIHGLTVWPD